MARIIQIIRGTSAQNDGFTGREGELTYDKTNNSLRVHDGVTQGGFLIGDYVSWGEFSGNLSSQTDLQTELSDKSDFTEMVGFDCGSISDTLDGDIIDRTPVIHENISGVYGDINEKVAVSIDTSGFLLRTAYNSQLAEAESYVDSLASQ